MKGSSSLHESGISNCVKEWKAGRMTYVHADVIRHCLKFSERCQHIILRVTNL